MKKVRNTVGLIFGVQLNGYIILFGVCCYFIIHGDALDPTVTLLLLWLWGEFCTVYRRRYRKHEKAVGGNDD